MKRLTCELCGSTDLIKQDGVFVCQICGAKYSIEEARKMMVEVSGTVQISNMAQVDSLLKLAQLSFESKNYAKAEDFCNQILSMDDSNYEVWKLKGESINGQLDPKGSRIDEVFNCIMMSYRLLTEEKKQEKRTALFDSLLECLRIESDFWLSQLEEQRPSIGAVKKAENSSIDCGKKIKQACEEMEFDDEITNTFLDSWNNYFIYQAETMLVVTWQSTVSYNYYKGKYQNGQWIDDTYRPSDEIFTTFLEEGDNLIELMHFCEKLFNEVTAPLDKKAVYSNIAFIQEALCDAKSYNRMVETTFGIISTRSEYWDYSRCLTEEAKSIRMKEIHDCRVKERIYQVEADAKEANKKTEEKRIAIEEARKRSDAYWSGHENEKGALENEQEELWAKIDTLNAEIMHIQDNIEIKTIRENIDRLNAEKATLGLFNGKEKKALQEIIDSLTIKVQDKMADEKSKIENQLQSLLQRMDEICEELTKVR